MISAHKVLAAYGCLAPRVITGQFDPTAQPGRSGRPPGTTAAAASPSPGSCGCRGVAVLPEGMSRERFAWLEDWVTDPGDIIRTPGTESNVKEIYDKCAELVAGPGQRDLQSVLPNSATTWFTTRAPGRRSAPGLRVAARGRSRRCGCGPSCPPRAQRARSAPAIISRTRYGAAIVAVEALECPTMLYNGFGEHNIQGIGDKHIPADPQRDEHRHRGRRCPTGPPTSFGVLFNHRRGLGLPGRPAPRRGRRPGRAAVSSGCRASATCWPPSRPPSTCDLGPDDVVMTVATDGAAMYASERERIARRKGLPGGLRRGRGAAEAFGRWMLAAGHRPPAGD